MPVLVFATSSLVKTMLKGGLNMEGCRDCEMIQKADATNIILQNEHALALTVDTFREGHCLVYLKRHVISVSAVEPYEYNSFFDLIAKVSKALEKKYSTRKTYVVTVGDSNKFQHLHFHLLPKHRQLPSFGVYCFQKLHEAEPKRNPSEADRKALAEEIRGIIQNP